MIKIEKANIRLKDNYIIKQPGIEITIGSRASIEEEDSLGVIIAEIDFEEIVGKALKGVTYLKSLLEEKPNYDEEQNLLKIADCINITDKIIKNLKDKKSLSSSERKGLIEFATEINAYKLQVVVPNKELDKKFNSNMTTIVNKLGLLPIYDVKRTELEIYAYKVQKMIKEIRIIYSEIERITKAIKNNPSMLTTTRFENEEKLKKYESQYKSAISACEKILAEEVKGSEELKAKARALIPTALPSFKVEESKPQPVIANKVAVKNNFPTTPKLQPSLPNVQTGFLNTRTNTANQLVGLLKNGKVSPSDARSIALDLNRESAAYLKTLTPSERAIERNNYESLKAALQELTNSLQELQIHA